MSKKILDKAIEQVLREMTPEERNKIKDVTKIIGENITVEECIRNMLKSYADEKNITIEEYVNEMTLEELVYQINYYHIWTRTKDSVRKFKEKMEHGVFVEHNSFLEPITSDMCRTSKSYPRKGYTSVSRIAKG